MRRKAARPFPVLLTARELGAGGIERDLAKYAMELDRTRFTPYVAAFQPYGVRAEEIKRAGVPILPLDVPSLKSAAALRSATQFVRFLRQNRIQLVHAFDPSAVFAVPLARLAGVPVVLSSTVGHRDLFDPATRKQLRLTDHLVDAMVVNCEAMRRHLTNDFGIACGKVDLCYNGVNTAEFYPGNDSSADAPVVVGSVCVLRPEKRMDLLMEAFARVRGLCPGARLLIVGSGPELGKLKDLAARLDLGGSCVFQPAVSDVAPLLRTMDIFVSCSNSEAFSNAILEAMACGCCLIGSRVGGTPELIADGERGFLFESENLHDLEVKLAMTITDAQMRAEMGARAAAFAATELNIQRAAGRLAEIYENRLRSKGVWN